MFAMSNFRSAYAILLGCCILFGCSSNTDSPQAVSVAPVSEQISINAVNSGSRDTIEEGEPFSVKVYLSHPLLSDMAKSNNIQRPIIVLYNSLDKMTMRDSAVMVGDTGVVKFTPVIENIKPGEVRPYIWTYAVKVDFQSTNSGIDTTFMARDIFYIKGKP